MKTRRIGSTQALTIQDDFLERLPDLRFFPPSELARKTSSSSSVFFFKMVNSLWSSFHEVGGWVALGDGTAYMKTTLNLNSNFENYKSHLLHKFFMEFGSQAVCTKFNTNKNHTRFHSVQRIL